MKIKPIGLRDVEQISLENKVLFFPNDYIMTESYTTFSQLEVGEIYLFFSQHTQKQEKEVKLPPAKRPNDWKLSFPYPLSPPLELFVGGHVKVHFQALKQVPERGALLFRPTEEDFKLLEQLEVKIGSEEQDNTLKNSAKNAENMSEYEQQLKTMKLKRDMIGLKKMNIYWLGFVTYGNFVQKEGRGEGKGVVIKNLEGCELPLLVLYRNRNSNHYYFGEIDAYYKI